MPEPVKFFLRNRYMQAKVLGRQKIFGIGRNKTGTTSLKAAMNELGFVVGRQRTAEKLIFDWAKRDF